jgi:D-serine deaminase-like pyridoxal phosphate-dependent protein
LAETATAQLLAHGQRCARRARPRSSRRGTGTFEQTGSTDGVTEIQAGSYVFMDGRYSGVRSDFETALTLHTTVLRRRGRLVITDAGVKSLSHDVGPPRAADLPLGVVGLSEEHGHLLIDEGADLPLAPGDRIRLLPSHGDTTINLHDRYYAACGDEVEAVWSIVGRGRFV